MSETFTLDGLIFHVRRSPRRRTLGLTVDRGGELVAHAPAHTPMETLERWVKAKLLWVHRRLATKQRHSITPCEPEFVAGESFCYLGRRYRLKLVETATKPLRLEGDFFHLRRDARPDAHKHFRQWYVREGSEWLRRRVAQLAPRVGVSPTRVAVRELGFRWGSCGKNGVLYFNWRLLQLPVPLVDYVVLHELVHLRVPRHGPSFWRELERALPGAASLREALQSSARDYLVFQPPTLRLPPVER